jgi:hypothetical protein
MLEAGKQRLTGDSTRPASACGARAGKELTRVFTGPLAGEATLRPALPDLARREKMRLRFFGADGKTRDGDMIRLDRKRGMLDLKAD